MVIDFYLDFISSFAYLARGRLLDIARRHGADIAYHPVDIAQLRHAAGNTGPSTSAIPPKMAYMQTDVRRWAALYGIPVVTKPAGYITAALNRGLYLAIERGQQHDYVKTASHCVWAEGRDPADAGTEWRVEEALGWARGEIAAYAATAAAQAAYERGNAAAIARGVFGVPTFIIGDEMWWGNDRLEFLDRYIAEQRGATA